ncbi:hypothetical protein [Nocardia sp. NPDC003345]
MSISVTGIATVLANIAHRAIYSGKMVGDCLSTDVRSVSANLRHTDSLVREDGAGADLLGGMPAGTGFFSERGDTAGDTLRSRLDSGRIEFRDFYDYVQRTELSDRSAPDAADRTINRAWGRAVAAKLDHLRELGVTGRPAAQAMWKWKADMERQARDMDGTLAFPAETARREPYLGRLYRGDKRSTEVIYDEGFRPRSTMTDSTHSWVPLDGPGADDWICMSKDPEVAARFPLRSRWFQSEAEGEVYVVRDAVNAQDKTGESLPNAAEELVVVHGGIPADKIEGVLVDRDDPAKGMVANPGFVPYEPSPVRPPREDDGWDNVVRDPS